MTSYKVIKMHLRWRKICAQIENILAKAESDFISFSFCFVVCYVICVNREINNTSICIYNAFNLQHSSIVSLSTTSVYIAHESWDNCKKCKITPCFNIMMLCNFGWNERDYRRCQGQFLYFPYVCVYMQDVW